MLGVWLGRNGCGFCLFPGLRGALVPGTVLPSHAPPAHQQAWGMRREPSPALQWDRPPPSLSCLLPLGPLRPPAPGTPAQQPPLELFSWDCPWFVTPGPSMGIVCGGATLCSAVQWSQAPTPLAAAVACCGREAPVPGQVTLGGPGALGLQADGWVQILVPSFAE